MAGVGLTFELTRTAEASHVRSGGDDSTAGADRPYKACRSGSGVEQIRRDFPPSRPGGLAPMSEITRLMLLIVRVGVDLAKSLIQIHAVDAAGRRVVARAFKRDQSSAGASSGPRVASWPWTPFLFRCYR